MSTKDLEYFEQHPEEMTDEIMEALMTGGVIEDDTDAEQSEEETGEESAAGVDQANQDKEPDQVVLAKDGKHTIPFEELEKSRAEARAAKEELESYRQKVAELESERAALQAARDEKAAAGEDTSELDEALRALEEDYPTISMGMDRKLATRDAEIEALKKEIADLKSAVTPIQKSARESAAEAHFNAIRSAHEDFDTLVENGKLAEWVKSLPAYARPGAEAVMERGSTQDVIELVTSYKSAHTTTTDSNESVADKAKQAIEKAKAKQSVPTSLSEVSAAGVPASEELGQYEQMSDAALMGAFMSMDPAKLNERLARLL